MTGIDLELAHAQFADAEARSAPGPVASSLHTADVGQVPLGELFPALAGTTLLAALLGRTSPRGLNALHREGARYFSDIAGWRIGELRRIRNVGDLTATDIVDALAEASAEIEGTSPPVARPGGRAQVGIADVQHTWSASRAVSRIAAWATAFVDPSINVVEAYAAAADAEDLPPEVAAAVNVVRTTSVSALALHVHPVTSSESFTAWFYSLTGRDTEILRRRTLAREPETLEALGEHLGISRERVRTLETSLLANAGGLFSPNWLPLARTATALREAAGPLAPVEDLPEVDIDATTTLPWLQIDDVEVIARLSGMATVEDGLLGWPDAAGWTARVRAAVHDGVAHGEEGLAAVDVALEDLGVKGSAADWAARFGYDTSGSVVMAPPRTAAERAYRLLVAAADPMSTDEIVAGLGVARDPKSVRSAMDLDERIVRVGPRHWACAAPGRRAFPGLRGAIGEALAENGGPMKFADLVAALRDHYVVSSHSVRVYAGRPPFHTVDGLVSPGEA